jgi:hypothetical protein
MDSVRPPHRFDARMYEKEMFVIARSSLKSRVCSAVLALSLFAPVALVVAAPAYAQGVVTGALYGSVVDLSGKALGGARVTITSAGSTHIVRTAPDGTFKIALPPDTYSVSAAVNGFQTTSTDGVTVLAGQTASVKLSLANASLQTIGTVSATRATQLNTTPGATANLSAQTFIDQGQAQVVNVLDQVPGVEINRSSSNAPGANTSISIRGAQPYESQILIDGHPVVTSANGAYGFNSTFINGLLVGDVEVDKGPGSMPNTIEDAIGGTLNFKTPVITGGPTANFVVGYDSFNGNYYAVKASDTFGKLGVFVGIANYQTPGYLAPQTIYGGATLPKVTAGTAYDPHIGVLNFGYGATQNFSSFSQLGKLSYNFSPQTSLVLSQWSTQSNDDETGTNYQYANALIVPCLQTKAPVGTCTPGGSGQNYTASPYLNLVGTVQPINLYAPYPDTSQFDNEPIYSAEFRTVAGPGSLLARYYTGAINRIITQTFNPYAVIPCTSPACPNGDDLTANPPYYNAYQGEPYVEDTIDILHGLDAQYTVPFGNNSVTLGFDRHTDSATFGEYDPTEGPPTFPQDLVVQSIAYSLRGTFALTPKLTLSTGNYFSSTTYVGTRFDPRDGLVYRINPNATVRAAYGSAYAAPVLRPAEPEHVRVRGDAQPRDAELQAGNLVGLRCRHRREAQPQHVDLGRCVSHEYLQPLCIGDDADGRASIGGKPIHGRYAKRKSGARASGGPRIPAPARAARRVSVSTPRSTRLRTYAYDQDPNVSINSIFNATPGNYVQLPSYPYFKGRNDVFYSFGNGSQARFSSTSYGANNAFGQAGFTQFDGELRLPLKNALVLNIGGTNLANHDDYRAGGIYRRRPRRISRTRRRRRLHDVLLRAAAHDLSPTPA